MLIEIHMIQNHSPANLNRDDLGAPKTCVFGGVMRARLSSQCLKRSIRRSPAFAAALEKDGGVRTRRLITILAERVHGEGAPPSELVEFVARAFEKGGVKRVDKKQAEERDNTNILLFLPQSAIDEMADVIHRRSGDSKKEQEHVAKGLAEILGHAACVPDMALCGRMMELDREGLFAKLNLRIEAALSAAHALSTHEVLNEVDYFTAVDDLARGTGAGHVDEAQFASACFYKYFCLDWDQLVANLTPGKADDAAEDEARRLAAATVGHFLVAAATTTPSGKQHSFAAHNGPDGVLVEVKKAKTPMSYANAFAEPARRLGAPPDDAADEVSLVGRSIAQLGDYAFSLRKANGVDSALLWYTPQPWRFPLRGWTREADGKKRTPEPLTDRCFAALEGEDGLVEAVLEAVGFDWASVRDAGRREAEG